MSDAGPVTAPTIDSPASQSKAGGDTATPAPRGSAPTTATAAGASTGGAERGTKPGANPPGGGGPTLGTLGTPAPGKSTGPEGPAESVVSDFMEQFSSDPQHPLGAFKDPHSTMTAGIEEHVGYVPGWLLGLCILAVLLAMIMWIPTSY